MSCPHMDTEKLIVLINSIVIVNLSSHGIAVLQSLYKTSSSIVYKIPNMISGF